MSDEVQLARFTPIAKQALENGYRGTVKIRDVYWLKLALYREAESKYRPANALKGDFYNGVGTALAIICARCGVYTRDSVNLLCAFNPDELASKKVSYGGPNVKSLLGGICPGCGTDTVEANFNASLLDQRFGKNPFIIGEAHIWIEGGAPPESGKNILQTLQPLSCERNKELKFSIYPVTAPWAENEQSMIARATATLMTRGVRLKGDGDCQFQVGEAHGKRFFALYLRQKEAVMTPDAADNLGVSNPSKKD